MEPIRLDRPPGEFGSSDQPVRINGHPVKKLRSYGGPEGPVSIQVEDLQLTANLHTYPLRVLQAHFWSISFVGVFAGEDLFNRVTATFWALNIPIVRGVSHRGEGVVPVEPPSFNFRLAVEVADWTSPWTPREYSRTLQGLAVSRAIPSLELETFDDPAEGFTFTCQARSLDSTLGEEINYWTSVIQSIREAASAQLIASQHADSLTTSFNFPPAISTACEQYLLYFVQFLADLGIQAEAEVQHKAAEVLFRVTPAEGLEALERIREALDAYLRLPTDPSFAVAAAEEHDLAVRQLEANVFHLQGQLAIAKAVLQAKDAAIEALELSNYRLRQIGGGAILSAGSGGAPASGEDSEAIIPGVVSVKEVEKGGFVLHTPEILRKLKRRFGGTAEG